MPIPEVAAIEAEKREQAEEVAVPDSSQSSDALSAMMKALTLTSGSSYGIDKNRWAILSTGAGVEGANMEDRMAVVYVVGYWLNRYHQSLNNWALVAVAWTSGLGTARAIAKQANKEPWSVTTDDIKKFNPGAYDASKGIFDKASGLISKGWTEGIDQPRPLVARPHTVITGIPNIYQEDRYIATVRELQSEVDEERKANQPTGAEMLFAQLDTLSGVVTGGEGRVDWRSDFSEAESGGSVQEMKNLERPEAI